jgi:uncharacterized cupin superfamily protein
MFHQRAAAVTGPLEPRGQREGADSGDPQISWTAFDYSDDVKVGVWEAAPGGWPIVNPENTETCHIVSRWDVIETIRKVYCIAVPTQATERNVG